jgi:TRAP-type C4-dicarboxylate transport system permease small subunit
MKNTIKALNKYAMYFSACLAGAIMLLIVLDVFLRNSFMVFIPGVFELTQILLSLVVFMALAYANDNKEHIIFDAIYKRLPQGGKWVFSFIGSLIMLAAIIVIGSFILQLAITQAGQGYHTPILRIVLWPFTILGAFGMLLFCLSVIGDLILIIKDREVLSIDSN